MEKKYAVEARIFNNGKIVAKMREAEQGEESRMRDTATCDIWIDIFDTYQEAADFLVGYKNA